MSGTSSFERGQRARGVLLAAVFVFTLSIGLWPARPASALLADSAGPGGTGEARPDFGLLIESLDYLEETATRIELTGRVLELDPQGRTLVISADSVGLLEGSIRVTAPQSFDFTGVKRGRVYSATVRRTATGDLRLTGFSPGYSGRAADDESAVFGEQGF